MTTLETILNQAIHGLPKKELTAFCKSWNVNKSIKRNELMCPQGQADTNIYFIEKGALKVCHAKNEKEIVVGLAYTNTFLYNLPPFYSENPTDFYIQAIKETTVTGITKTEFENWLITNLVISNFWRKRIEQLLLDLVERQIDILSNSPEERYFRLFNRDAAIFHHIPARYIAAYLGMTPETLSRLNR